MNVLITGASSGIGEALALACARRGDTVFFCGRDRARTNAVADRCRAAGAKAVYPEILDVTDEAAMRDWLGRCDKIAPLERIFSNAGVGTGIEDEENVRRTCPMPFFMEADKAARIILSRADRNVGLIAFPWPMRLATWFLSILPFRLNEFVNSLLPAKTTNTTPTPF